MRVAFFSPLPPSKSGIADYSEALLGPLRSMARIETFAKRPERFDPAAFDVLLYQIGNNPHHDFVYEMALEHPGVVVMHEANLHHLIAEITIKRGDWEGYLREAEYNGGPAALAFAHKVRKLQAGPDYEGLPMLRRVLESSKAAIVHSRYVESELRRAGFDRPVAVIPHGAWIPEADGLAYRGLLGLDASTPLIGAFGFLKPYKRIAESLRAFRRLLRVDPRVRMILVGEAHPDFPVHSLIRSLGLADSVRVLGFTPIADFTGYVAACDIVLNLRHPTVGESSGSLLRAMGLGKAVLVSNVGSFAELPDDVCFKIPVDSTEEDQIFEYLNLLVSRPAVARGLGRRAKQWVEQQCGWACAAAQYTEFLEAIAAGRTPEATVISDSEPAAMRAVAAAGGGSEPREPESGETVPDPIGDSPVCPRLEQEEVARTWRDEQPAEQQNDPLAEYIRGWAVDAGSKAYLETHISRLVHTLGMVPPGAPDKRILEMGAYIQMTPALKTKLGYGEVRGCYYGALGQIDRKEVESAGGERFRIDLELFDAEKDRFPYEDEYFDTVLCCELIEHLFADPMHTLSEINRVLKPGGHLLLTTPNIASLRAISAILQGYHPGFFSQYLRPAEEGETEARHNREYAPREIHELLTGSGFEVVKLETGPFRAEPEPRYLWVRHLLDQYRLSSDLRGEDIFGLGRKTGPVKDRYPSWLYA